jgi:uncharacterized membrane protein YsdA (DUF1294 family)
MLSPTAIVSHIQGVDLMAGILIVNLVTFGLFYADKKAAEGQNRRISEKMLLLWCAVGGSPGGYLAMQRFRHKTRKQTFRQAFFMIVAVQAFLLARWAWIFWVAP